MSTGSEFQSPTSTTAPSGFRAAETGTGTGSVPPGWHKPLPERLPQPGYWPAIMGLGITFMLWGLAVGFNEVVSTIIILFFIGLVLFLVALAGWIGDLRYERKDQNE